jgi:hypothetical protein
MVQKSEIRIYPVEITTDDINDPMFKDSNDEDGFVHGGRTLKAFCDLQRKILDEGNVPLLVLKRDDLWSTNQDNPKPNVSDVHSHWSRVLLYAYEVVIRLPSEGTNQRIVDYIIKSRAGDNRGTRSPYDPIVVELNGASHYLSSNASYFWQKLMEAPKRILNTMGYDEDCLMRGVDPNYRHALVELWTTKPDLPQDVIDVANNKLIALVENVVDTE